MRVATDSIRVLDGENRSNSDRTIIQSVGKEGIIQPIIVYEDEDGGYVLVGGHRRLASAIHFSLPDVPIEVVSKERAEVIRALENLDRKGLHPLDEALEIRALQSQGYDNSVISAMLGISAGKLLRRAKLNNLVPEVKKDFLEGTLSAAAAEEYSVMDQKDQKAVWKAIHEGWGGTDPKRIREEYLSSRGLDLSLCSAYFRTTMEPVCSTCPKNLASDATLFQDEQGSCSDGKCYCEKIRRLMAEEGVESVYAGEYNSKKHLELLQKNGINAAKDNESWRYRTVKSADNPVKKMDIYGVIHWGPKIQKKKEITETDLTRQKELKKLWRKDLKELYAKIRQMVIEDAEAYMAKHHKNEIFPDSDERIILAKQILHDNPMALRCFIAGTRDFKENPIEGMDNKQILALALFLVATGCNSYLGVCPESVQHYHLSQTLPKSMDIADLYNLKTSKAKTRILELKKEMEGFLKEYKDLEGK